VVGLLSELANRLMIPFFVLKNSILQQKPKLTIPFGRHSYGPQPVLLGRMPWLAQKARGSKVGNFCSLSDEVAFSFLGKHNYRWVSTYPFYDFFDVWGFEDKVWHKGVPDIERIEPKPIVIENDVWIASNVVIKENVKIHNGAVVAMGSLVTKDVPAYALVGGNPARVIKYRFTPEQIQELEEIAWWNWSDKEIKRVLPLLLSEDIDGLIEYSRNQS
jgi:acetyltransferase-like isoleucine patch superfamily enzyme